MPHPVSLLLALACLGLASVARGDGPPRGEETYRRRCASCHGANGEGSAEYKKPLIGDRSVPQLASLIARTMPEDDPGTCVGEEADQVAAYIHDTFYSKVAQARRKPARVELSRLTVKQYRNTIADLVGSFRKPAAWGERRGLQGDYFSTKRIRDRDKALGRVDPVVDFDFARASPDASMADPKEFAIKWEGSVLAGESGDYEFIVKSENSIQLWVNDPKRPLIDATVKSGDDNEYRGTIRLLGGRPYDLMLQFSKSKQGVEDSKEKKAKAEINPASVRLEWKPPHRQAEVVPSRSLSPDRSPEVFVASTPFPPDDRSVGYERGSSVSKAWDAATTDAAIETADYVLAHLKELSGVGDDTPDRVNALKGFARTFARRGFRRALTDEQVERYVDRPFVGSKTPEVALKRVILLVLKSPRFLYREVGGPDGYDVAARLSYTLWDAPPDQALLDLAASGKLDGPDEIAHQAERLASDLRARAKLRDFFLMWLRVEGGPEIAKDPAAFPGFDQAVVSDLRTSLERSLDDLVAGDPADFRKFLLDDSVYLNGRLARFYGAEIPPDGSFRKVRLDADDRAGVLTHPYLLANFAYTATSSPIHRGVFVARSVLGRGLRPPPVAVAPLAPDLHASLSTRERVALQTSPTECMTCHGMINPLGFGLERFDAVGRLRKDEKGRPVDASGTYQTRDGGTIAFTGARGLADYLAGSDEVHSALVDQLFHHLVKQPIPAYGPEAKAKLLKAFAESGYSLKSLSVAIAKATALPSRPATP